VTYLTEGGKAICGLPDPVQPKSLLCNFDPGHGGRHSWEAPADRFEDARGVIQDILTTGPLDAVTRIFTKAGAVRGNHYHAETIQWCYVLIGKLLVATRPPAGIAHHVYGPGELACEEAGVAHAWKALEDTDVLVFTRGPRSGENYESDVTRLEVPLL
jgi:quercetin dioxygenase-like cupin family protein